MASISALCSEFQPYLGVPRYPVSLHRVQTEGPLQSIVGPYLCPHPVNSRHEVSWPPLLSSTQPVLLQPAGRTKILDLQHLQ